MDILVWFIIMGWSLTLIVSLRFIYKLQKLQRQYFGMVNDYLEYFGMVNDYLEYYNNLRDEFLKFIDSYNSSHEDKIIYKDGKFTLVRDEEVEPINIDDL